MKDKEKIEQLRLKERTGGYHKYTGNPLTSNIDVKTDYFISGSIK